MIQMSNLIISVALIAVFPYLYIFLLNSSVFFTFGRVTWFSVLEKCSQLLSELGEAVETVLNAELQPEHQKVVQPSNSVLVDDDRIVETQAAADGDDAVADLNISFSSTDATTSIEDFLSSIDWSKCRLFGCSELDSRDRDVESIVQ